MNVDSIGIPIRADYRALSSDFNGAYGQVQTFAQKASAPVPVGLNLRPLRADVGKAREMVERLAEFASEHLGETLAGKTEHALAKRIAPSLVHATKNAMLGKSAVDAASGRATEVVVTVSQEALKGSLGVAAGTVRGAVHAMSAAGHVALTVTHIGMAVGVGLAQAYLFKAVKDMTGASTVKLLATYAGVRVGLGLASALVRASVRAAARVAVIPIRVSLAALRAGLAAARSMVGSAARSMAGLAAIPLSPLGLAVGGAGIAAGLGASLVGSVKAASDLNETVSKVGYTFNRSADVVTAGADEMARKYGVLKRSFLDGAAGIGLIAKGAGQSDAEAAKLGVNMARLATDLGSFANIPFEDALQKVRSGLVGEHEPLRAVGVLLNEAAVQAKAAEMGFGAVGAKLSEGQKVMARSALITQGLATASGDLSRTSGALANRLREVWGRVQNLSAEVGQRLLPAAQSLATAFSDVAKDAASYLERNRAGFDAWGQSIKRAADWLGVAYRNLSDIKSVAGLAMNDFGANALAAWKSIETYLKEYAVYFGETLSRSIEDGVARALNASAGKAQALGARVAGWGKFLAHPLGPLGGVADHLMGRAAGGAANAVTKNPRLAATALEGMLDPIGAVLRRAAFALGRAVPDGVGKGAAVKAAVGRAVGQLATAPLRLAVAAGTATGKASVPGFRPPIAPPTFKAPEFRKDPGIGKTLADVAAKEKVRDLTETLRSGLGTALSVAGAAQGAFRGANAYRADAEQGRADRMNRATAFEARGRSGLADLPGPRAVETAAARARRMRVTPEAGMAALGQLQGALGGAMAGMAGAGAAAAVPAGTLAPAVRAAQEATGKPRFAGLAEKGSKEDYSAIIRFAAGGNKGPDKTAKDQLEVQKKMLDELRKGGAPRKPRQPSAV